MTLGRGQKGTALLETLVTGLLLLAPLMSLLTTAAHAHRAALAVAAAARDASFEAARSPSVDHMSSAVDAAAQRALIDHGFDPATALVRWATVGDEEVVVSVAVPVPVVAVPFVDRTIAAITLSARERAPIDPHRGP